MGLFVLIVFEFKFLQLNDQFGKIPLLWTLPQTQWIIPTHSLFVTHATPSLASRHHCSNNA
jgi:hypothetical protein